MVSRIVEEVPSDGGGPGEEGAGGGDGRQRDGRGSTNDNIGNDEREVPVARRKRPPEELIREASSSRPLENGGSRPQEKSEGEPESVIVQLQLPLRGPLHVHDGASSTGGSEQPHLQQPPQPPRQPQRQAHDGSYAAHQAKRAVKARREKEQARKREQDAQLQREGALGGRGGRPGRRRKKKSTKPYCTSSQVFPCPSPACDAVVLFGEPLDTLTWCPKCMLECGYDYDHSGVVYCVNGDGSLARRAAKEGEAPALNQQSPRKKGGEVKKVATGADAAWDEDEERLGALIYKYSRTAQARADAEEKKRRRTIAAPHHCGDELQPPTQKQRRKASLMEGASPLAAAAAARITPHRDETPTKRQIDHLHDLENKWTTRYDQLREYKKEHGHCNVPKRWAENRQLATWVQNQRTLHKNGKLPGDRIQRLEGIEFRWVVGKGGFKADDGLWNKRFEELKTYKEEHGDCKVPQRYAKSPPLGSWVQWQRVTYKSGKLPGDRIQLLGEIGFQWRVGAGKRKPDDELWNERLEQLRAYNDSTVTAMSLVTTPLMGSIWERGCVINAMSTTKESSQSSADSAWRR